MKLTQKSINRTKTTKKLIQKPPDIEIKTVRNLEQSKKGTIIVGNETQKHSEMWEQKLRNRNKNGRKFSTKMR